MHILKGGIHHHLLMGIALSIATSQQAYAQLRSLSSELELAQDAVGRTQTRLPNLRIDETSSRTVITQLQSAMGTASRGQTGRLFPGLTLEPADSVVRCASRAERGSNWCASLSPRNVLLLYRATRNEDSSVVIWVQAIQWQKAQSTHPSSAVWKFQYRRALDGTWKFDRELGGVAS